MSDVEMVLPGRSAKDEIIEQADLVTAGIEHKREEGALRLRPIWTRFFLWHSADYYSDRRTLA